ncbi:MAG: efflux transporter outer membrane subunit [Phycisphaerae bacterium]
MAYASWIKPASAGTLVFGGVIVGGCTVGPDYTRPDTAAENARYSTTLDPSTQPGPAELLGQERWWEEFADPISTALVERALEQNLTLRQAALRVVQADALRRARYGERLPFVSAGAGASANRLPGGVNTEQYSLGLAVSWQADLVGGLRRAERAAVAELLAETQNARAVAHTLVADVLAARVNLGTLLRQLQLQQTIVENRRQTLEIVRRRYEQGAGGVSVTDLRLAQENLAAAQSTIPTIERQLGLVRNQLAVLVNLTPAELDALPDTLDDLPSLPPLPLGIPAALLDRRPDVLAAEFRTIAANERIGVAVSDLYPDLIFSADAGYRADDLADLIDADSFVANLAGDLLVRLFEGGRLRANVDAAEAVYGQQALEYASVVLRAIREVEDALLRQRTLLRELDLLVLRVEEARAAEQSARERYQRGLESLLQVLEAERRRNIAETELIRSRGELWQSRIDLVLALGGDWQTMPLRSIEANELTDVNP